MLMITVRGGMVESRENIYESIPTIADLAGRSLRNFELILVPNATLTNLTTIRIGHSLIN
jgi:hypothetical protein